MTATPNSLHTYESVIASAKQTAGNLSDRDSVLLGILGTRHAALLNQLVKLEYESRNRNTTRVMLRDRIQPILAH